MHAAPGSNAIRRVMVAQGDSRTSRDPLLELTTVLGSCVSACFYDAEARVGGMNHFVLAGGGGGHEEEWDLSRYGIHAMELVINAMLGQGASRERMRAQLFGGASMSRCLRDFGAANARFAREFLLREHIILVGGDLGGNCARRVDFRPAAGLARCRRVVGDLPAPPRMVPPSTGGEVELFEVAQPGADKQPRPRTRQSRGIS